MNALSTVFVPVHKEGYPFIGIAAIISIILLALFQPLGWIMVVLTCWCVYFFRDPERVTPDEDGVVVSPGDGVVSMIEEATPPEELGLDAEPLTRISIFLNVFNVHVNRVPVGGKITALHYRPGKFLNASLDKASEDNERQSAAVTTEDGKTVVFVQIAGLVARRIVCDLEDNQEVKTGERFGIIRFGSRVDVYLPKGVTPAVAVGQQMIGGETILAELKGKKSARVGVVR